MSAQSTYAYRARDGTGTVVAGTMVAGSAVEVTARLRADGKFVVAIEENPLRAAMRLDKAQVRRNEAAKAVRREDVIAFAQQLAVMLETGVPLFEAIRAFTLQYGRREFRQVLEALCGDIEAGEPMSRAMEKWPGVFPGLMVALVKASEASGTLAKMLGRVAMYLGKERRTRRQIRGALAYPLFMMATGVAITVFLMSFVLPRFSRVWEKRIPTLPAPTRVLLAVSEFITTQYWWYVPAATALLVTLLVWRARPSGRRLADWCRLNLPLLRVLYGHLYVTRAARTMSTLLGAGVNVLDVIDICRGVTGNVYYDQLWDSMAKGVRDGRQLSEVVSGNALVPAHVASMIAAGERSGRLPEVMEKVADFAEEELDGAVGTVTTFIEPAMIVVMGALIGGIAIGLLLPILTQHRYLMGG